MSARLFNFALSVSLMSSAPSAWAQIQSLTPTPKRTTFTFTFKFPSKVERKPVSFEIVNGLLVFRAKLNGQMVWAILDNAMGMSLIDKQFAMEQNIAFGPVVGPLRTPSGSLERRIAPDVPIELPGQISWTAPFSVVDLGFLAKATGRPITMVVGKEYFATLTFVILPTRKTFEVGPSGALKIPAGTPFAPIEDDGARVQVDVGGRKLSLLIDLGATGQLLLSRAAWTQLGLDQASQRSGRYANLNGKVLGSALVEVPTVAIGPFVRKRVIIQSRPTVPPNADGFVGLGFLANFNFAIDVRGRKLWLLTWVKATAPATAPSR